MKLKELLPNTEKFCDTEITSLTDDSREVIKGSAFVCINGPTVDGHKFAQNAVNAGAAVVICERDLGLPNQIIVDDTHTVFADMCARKFGNPAKKLHIIGVTGTNGKTSVTYMIKKILEANGEKVGLIGTIRNMIGEKEIESNNTTPGIYDLNSLFAQMVQEGCTYVVMEVSSHALHQQRVCGFRFNEAVFTNLTQDHLDYHETMENYFLAKCILFDMCDTAIINADDPYGARLLEKVTCKKVSYSLGNESTFSAKNIKFRPDGVDYELFYSGEINHISVSTAGRFTVYNSMAAAACAVMAGIAPATASTAVSALEGVKGRAEVVPNDLGFTIIIDYAHTPDGLKNILSAFRDCEKNRLTVLFGCGGDRDKTKRPIMGSVAVHNADNVIITSDNPRTEEPSAIIADIVEGTHGMNTPIKVIENRIEAIKYAVSSALPGDIVVLAGKGHEDYQILKTGKIHLDEREVVLDAIKELKNSRG